jgi:hypothetical protein
MNHSNGKRQPYLLLRCLLEWGLNRYQCMMILRITVSTCYRISHLENVACGWSPRLSITSDFVSIRATSVNEYRQSISIWCAALLQSIPRSAGALGQVPDDIFKGTFQIACFREGFRIHHRLQRSRPQWPWCSPGRGPSSIKAIRHSQKHHPQGRWYKLHCLFV